MIFSQMNRVVFPIARVTPDGPSLLGTCFLISKPGHFATAAHVVKSDDKNLVIIIPKMLSTSDYQDTSNHEVEYFSAKITAIDPFRDVCILVAEGTISANFPISGTDVIQTGEDVVAFGFPHADNGRMVLTQQRAEVGGKILIECNGIKSKYTVLNILARPGQSGSPIFRLNDLSLVGILLGSYAEICGGGITLGGVNTHSINQTTHAISAEYLKEMI